MTKIYKAYVYEIEGTETSHSYFQGEIEDVNMNTNIPELRDEPYLFSGDTEAALLADMIAYLKASGRTGVLRVV